jgi:beta-glucosidase
MMRSRPKRALVTSGLVGVALACAAVSPAAATPCGHQRTRPWCDASLQADQRADLLLATLTQDEKLSLLAGVASAQHTGQTAAIARVGLRSIAFTDDSKGVKQGRATALPIPIALAASFDTQMARRAGTVIADEARKKGNDVILGPTVNIMRTPFGGRTFEAYGEDPYLVSRTAVAWIEAAQRQGVIAEVKHFCCNNQEGKYYALGEKEYSSSDLDERTLREIYLPAFEAAVKEARVGTIMCAYNRVNGDWACAHHHLLTDILKREWGFKGAVVSDWQAQHDTVDALRNGLDLEMPTASDYAPTRVRAALASGLATQAEVDDHVHRLLRTMFAFGFFDRPAFADDDTQIDVAGHAAIAQRMEAAGTVLLKNAGILPLHRARVHSIALIGPQADRFENGGGTDDVTPFTYTTARQAITARAGSGTKVVYDDGSDSARAATTAAAADVAIVFASDTEGEYNEKACASVDCTILGHTGNQDALIAAVAAQQPNTIVVLETGGPVLTPWRKQVRGLLEAWYPGEEQGPALARVLFGDADPGGRLPVTFPDSESQLAVYGDPTAYPGTTDVSYKEGVLVGYRWFDARRLRPAFPFGFGLSYTRSRFDRLRIDSPGRRGAAATVRVRLTNMGVRRGTVIPQLYLGLPSPASGVVQPPRQLKGYAKVVLAPGHHRAVSFSLDDRAFSYWDAGTGRWRVAPGCYGVYVGRSSRDLPLSGVIARGGASCR